MARASRPGSFHILPSVTLLLIGLRASGKSTLAPLLAHQLGLPWHDLDHAVATALSFASPSQAFAADPARFRETEGAELARLLTLSPMVLALGGGTPAAPNAQAHIRSAQHQLRARVVYLHALPSELRRRMSDAEPRPPVLGVDALGEVEMLYEQRNPLYRSLADHVVEVEGRSPPQVVREVCGLLRNPIC